MLSVPGALLYFEELGNADGAPALYLHGGPGGAIAPANRSIFDPKRYRAILMEQRGCGRSKPRGQLSGNTTEALISDIEALRRHLGIVTWVVIGGSWGAALATAYAQRHPEAVAGLVLRGTFLARPADVDWIYGGKAGALAPAAWEAFIAPAGGRTGKPLLHWYNERLNAADLEERRAAALACRRWSETLAHPDKDALAAEGVDIDALLDATRIKLAYFMNDCFMSSPNQLLEQAHRLKDTPGVIVHGAQDIVCRLEGALALHAAWPSSRLVVVEAAGHAQTDPAIIAAMREALDKFPAR